ncbi:MAG: GNAT family N-acetyltransferase [Holosporales bacterium]|jgi:RimJ/RimL family protein N-acetyltransferase
MIYTTRLLHTTADAALLDAFLKPHTAAAFHIRSNAAKAGLVYHGNPYEAEYLGAFNGERLVGVVGYNWRHTLLLYIEELGCIPLLAHALVPLIQQRGGVLEGILGLPQHCQPLIATLNLPDHCFRCKKPERLYGLALHDLSASPLLQDPTYHVRRAIPSDAELLYQWNIAFDIEALHTVPGTTLEQNTVAKIDRRIALRELFLLEHDAEPLAFCGISGFLMEVMYIGSVYTPPPLRNRGYAKAVTAGAIFQRHQEQPSLQQAILIVENSAAKRAYQAIGFQKISDYQLTLVREDYRYIPHQEQARE